jgi:small subunit ribosomal protein S16
VAVKIKLKRLGKIRAPYYRIVVADARTKRDGRAIEEIGKYHPKEQPSLIEVDSQRVQHWLTVGAQPTEPVLAILKVTGDWQTFRGLPGAEGTLAHAEPRADRKAIFEQAARESLGEPKDGAITPRAKRSPKREDAVPSADAELAADAPPVTSEPVASESAASQPVASQPVASQPDASEPGASKTAAPDAPAAAPAPDETTDGG